jgi:hypothetical protein
VEGLAKSEELLAFSITGILILVLLISSIGINTLPHFRQTDGVHCVQKRPGK